MNILFICGSIEAGKDGVGDYTRLIAGEIASQNNKTFIVAINDTHQLDLGETTASINYKGVNVLRLSPKLSEKKRFDILKGSIRKYKPDLISLQYVPYSYSKFGTPLLLGTKLKKIYSGKWHLMVHEPYISTAKSWKEEIIQMGQKLSLFLIAKTLKPEVINTSTKEYQRLLSRIFLKSKILGLFGNISINKDCEELKKASSSHSKEYKAVYFGAAPKVENHIIVAKKIITFCKKNNTAIIITFCGKSSNILNLFIATLKEVCDNAYCKIVVLGELDEKELSRIFCTSDFGIARIPPRFIGKSGAAIAMLEHGLPLWIPLNDNEVLNDYIDFRQDLCFYELDDFNKVASERVIQSRLPAIASKMLEDIK